MGEAAAGQSLTAAQVFEPVAASAPATRMYGLFATLPVVALATPMTASYRRPALDFLSHCEFRGMTA